MNNKVKRLNSNWLFYWVMISVITRQLYYNSYDVSDFLKEHYFDMNANIRYNV